MRKNVLLASLLFAFGLSARQEPQAKSQAKTSVKKEVSETTSQKIKQLEKKIAINETDPSYPKEVLLKEKETLAQLKSKTVKSN